MSKCPNCNHWNSDSAKFCENCGNKISQNISFGRPSKTIVIEDSDSARFRKNDGNKLPQEPSSRAPSGETGKPKPAPKSNVGDVWKVIVTVVLWIAVIGGIVLFWMNIVSKTIAMGISIGSFAALRGMANSH